MSSGGRVGSFPFPIAFIIFSTAIFLLIGNPVTVLVWAGTINGFILPFGLAVVLIGSRNSKVVGDYIHPLFLQVAGWLVVGVMAFFSLKTLLG